MFCWCFKYIVLATVIPLIYFKFKCSASRRSPIFHIYQRPTCFYWLKVGFMFCIISLRQCLKRKKPAPEELEKPQPLSYHDKAIDAVYFNAGNEHGDYLVTGTARRKQKLVDTFLILKIADSGLGVLVIPKFPDTSLYKTEENDEYSVEGLTITPVIPMKKWTLKYNGKMKKEKDDSVLYDVEISLDWTSNLPFFNFDTEMDALLTAKYVALEPWSSEFFKTLEDAHQTHYEQFGKFSGTASVNGKLYELVMDSCRDHSFGKKRHWDMFHRYALHYITAENGDRFAILKICAPIIGSDIILGYVCSDQDKKCYPLQSCDLLLYQHGEGGDPSRDYAFSFTANNEHYTMQITVVDSPVFYISKDWEAKVWERLCTACVNGMKGWGIAEWQYRNVAGRAVTN